jgi:hypothetical protein
MRYAVGLYDTTAGLMELKGVYSFLMTFKECDVHYNLAHVLVTSRSTQLLRRPHSDSLVAIYVHLHFTRM